MQLKNQTLIFSKTNIDEYLISEYSCAQAKFLEQASCIEKKLFVTATVLRRKHRLT